MAQKILVVDDEADVVELVAFNLEAAGFEVDSAFDGAQALMRARATRPDLIVLDVMLPEMDGISICEMIRRDPSTRSIPVILLTSWSSEQAIALGYAAGATDYVLKPFSPRDLTLRVRNILSAHPPSPPAPILP